MDQYVKQSDEQWSIKFHKGEDKILKLASVNWQIALQYIYQRIDFSVNQEEE
ncbi:MAG: hypothetical protein AB4058_20210 [Microcystaceae cyanobacterium]